MLRSATPGDAVRVAHATVDHQTTQPAGGGGVAQDLAPVAAVRQNAPYRRRDEAHMRHFYEAYRRVMNGGPAF